MSGKILADIAFGQWRPAMALLLNVSPERCCRRVEDGHVKSEGTWKLYER